MSIYIVFAILFAAIMGAASIYVAFWHQSKDAKPNRHAHTPHDNRRYIDAAMKQFNSRVEWTTEEEDLVGRYKYQGGHFNIRLTQGSPYARLSYLFVHQQPLNYLELVRNVCNQCNLNAETCRVVYTINAKKGEVDLHIISTLLLSENNAHDMLARAMDSAFQWQRTFIIRINELKESSESVINHDVEKETASWKRELFLIREQEIEHQDVGEIRRSGADSPILLRNILATTLSLTDIVPGKLTLSRQNVTKIMDDADDILNFDISTALIADGAFIDTSSVALLDYYDPRNPVRLRHLTMGFSQEGKTDDTLYYRLTMALAPLSAGKMTDVHSLEREQLTRSVLIGHDLTPPDKRLEKFRYIWKETMAKAQSSDKAKLTDEERLLLSLATPNYGQMMLRARALYREGRFYESLGILEDLFHRMQGAFDRMGKTTQEAFFELCYLLGSCYQHIGQHPRATQFLQIAITTRRITYAEAFINSLVNSNDFRAMYFIDMFLMETQETTDNEQDETAIEDLHNAYTFANFLKRRKAYLLVSRAQYDEAETLLKQMLKDYINSDFALKELAYIQRMKKQ